MSATATTTVRAKVTAAPGVDTVTFTAAGYAPLELAPDDDGYWSATWEVGEDALTTRTVPAGGTATGGGHDLSADVSLILGSAPVLPVGTVDDFEGYGDDPRTPEHWRLVRLREASATAAWAHQVGDEQFEEQGHRMIHEALE